MECVSPGPLALLFLLLLVVKMSCILGPKSSAGYFFCHLSRDHAFLQPFLHEAHKNDLEKMQDSMGVMIHAYNPSIEAETEGLQV